MIQNWRGGIPCLALAALLFGWSGTAAGQQRLSDKELEKVLNSLKGHAGKFSGAFKQDLSKSSIHKTTEEKEAKELADQFPKQIDELKKQFKNKKKAGPAFAAVSQTYTRLNGYMGKVTPTAKTTEAWNKVNVEMNRINQAFAIAPTA